MGLPRLLSKIEAFQYFMVGAIGFVPHVLTVKNGPVPSFWAEWAAVALVMLLAVISLRSTGQPEEKRRFQMPWAAWSFLALALIVLFQLVAKQPRYVGASLLVVGVVSLAAAVCVAGARIRHTDQILNAWAVGLLLALVLNFAAVLLEIMGWRVYSLTLVAYPPQGRTVGLVGQSNQLSIFAVMACSAGLYLWLCGKLSRPVYLFIAIMVSTCIVTAGSRAGALTFLLMLLLSWLTLRSHARGVQGRRLILATLLILAAVQLAWVLGQTALSSGDGPAGGTIFRSSTEDRLALLKDSIELAWMHPWTGVGFGNFSGARWTELSGPLVLATTLHSHNLVTQLAVEIGWVGALLVLLPAAYGVWRGLRALRTAPLDAGQFLALSIVITILVYSMVEFPLWHVYFLLPFAFALGMIKQKSISFTISSAMFKARYAFLALVAGLCGLVAMDYRRSEQLVIEVTQAAAANKNGLIIIPRDKASDIARLTAFEIYAEYMMSRTLELDTLFMPEKLRITERAMLGLTNDESIARHIAFLAVAGKETEAKALFSRTRRDPLLEERTYAILVSFSRSNPLLSEFMPKLPKPSIHGMPPSP